MINPHQFYVPIIFISLLVGAVTLIGTTISTKTSSSCHYFTQL